MRTLRLYGEVPHTDPVFMSRAEAMELVALTQGVPVTKDLVLAAFAAIGCTVVLSGKFDHAASFYLEDGVGVRMLLYGKETLARHFILFRDFIADNPTADKLPLPKGITSNAVESVLNHVLGQRSVTPRLLHADLYILQLLNPISDLVPFTFSLIGTPKETIVSLFNKISDAERHTMMQIRNVRSLVKVTAACPYFDVLPDDGRGLGLLATFVEGRRYLASEEGAVILQDHPSWLFVNAVTHARVDPYGVIQDTLLIDKLIDRGFDDECPFVGCADAERIADSLCIILPSLTCERFKRACRMLGLRHPRLENTDLTCYAPYQLTIDVASLPRYMRDAVQNELKERRINLTLECQALDSSDSDSSDEYVRRRKRSHRRRR